MNCKQFAVYTRGLGQECVRYVLYIENSTGSVIRVKLIRHFRNGSRQFRNGDCGTNEVHAKPIIRMKFRTAIAAVHRCRRCRRRRKIPSTSFWRNCARRRRLSPFGSAGFSDSLPEGPMTGLRGWAPRGNVAPDNPLRDRRIDEWVSLNKAVEIESTTGSEIEDSCSFHLTRYRAEEDE